MTFNPTRNVPKVSDNFEAEYLRRVLTVLIFFAVLFIVAGVVVFMTKTS